MYDQATVAKLEKFYGSLEVARNEYRKLAQQAKADIDNTTGVQVSQHGQLFTEHSGLEFNEQDACPLHGTPHRRTYTFGSSLSAETEVCTFSGCQCAVAVRHDPLGFSSASTYHKSFDQAAGVGRLHAEMAKAKYR